jgi:hypothetical protein
VNEANVALVTVTELAVSEVSVLYVVVEVVREVSVPVVFVVMVIGQDQGHKRCASGSLQRTPSEQKDGSLPVTVVVTNVVEVIAHVQGHSSKLLGILQSIM